GGIRSAFVATATAIGLFVDGARVPVYLFVEGRVRDGGLEECMTDRTTNTRRTFLTTGAALIFVSPSSFAAAAQEPEVTATEDLMREHGVIRRCLLLYEAVVPRLRA